MTPRPDTDRPNIFPSQMALYAACEHDRSAGGMPRLFSLPLCLIILIVDHASDLIWRLGAVARAPERRIRARRERLAELAHQT